MTRTEDLSPAALLEAALNANSPGLNANSPGRVLRALVAKALTRRRRLTFTHELPAHLRRDIGMAPQAPPPIRPELLR